MLDPDFVLAVHDEIVIQFGGLTGFAQRGPDGVQSALNRVSHYALYDGLNDVFGIAALYAVAIARGHVFNDANKRTGLTCALVYLEQQGISIPKSPMLEDVMVDVAEGRMDFLELASFLSSIWTVRQEGEQA